MELRTERLYLRVERFGKSICGTGVKKVQDRIMMVLERVEDGDELVSCT